MKNDPEIYKKANGFDKNPQNINKAGRPKKIYTIIKQMGYSADDIRTSFGELAFYTLKELKQVHTDDDKHILLRIIANQFFKALKDSDWNKIREILEHVIGKPNSSLDVTSGGEKITPKIIVTSEQAKNDLNDMYNEDD